MSNTTNRLTLGVNIDHVATIRNARGGREPSVLHAALVAEQAGGDLITVHLREDRRHIRDDDVYSLARHLTAAKLNLEMAATDEMITIAKDVKPYCVSLVPEKRQELTTEGGLNLDYSEQQIIKAREILEPDTMVSLFINPNIDDINKAQSMGIKAVELHTGRYAESYGTKDEAKELETIIKAAYHASKLGMIVKAGHGLNYHNVASIAAIEPIVELNIGHSIVSRSIFIGLDNAVRDMLALMMR